MSDSWDDYAEGWDTNEDAIICSKNAYEPLVDIVNLEGLKILDFGCGTGLLTEKMSLVANMVVALDSSEKMISILNDKNLSNVSTVPEILTANLIKNHASFHDKFNLIVASSVFGFCPGYKRTLILLKSLLVPDGILVQWDWLSPSNESDFGLTEEKIESAYKSSGLILKSVNKSFSLTSSKSTMSVLMAVAKNA